MPCAAMQVHDVELSLPDQELGPLCQKVYVSPVTAMPRPAVRLDDGSLEFECALCSSVTKVTESAISLAVTTHRNHMNFGC